LSSFLSCKGNLKRNIQNNSRETSKKLRNEAHHTVCEIVNDNWKEVYAGFVTSERLNNFECKQTEPFHCYYDEYFSGIRIVATL
jgi:hypothetical protein